jgi:hypothetical protein
MEDVPDFPATPLNSESWTIRTKTPVGHCSPSEFARMSAGAGKSVVEEIAEEAVMNHRDRSNKRIPI